MLSHQVLYEKLSPHIAPVTLNRPEKRNTVNGAVTRLMVRYVRLIEEDPDFRVAILTAAGRGHELTAGGNGFAGFVNARRRKPWIAAVRGFALGGAYRLPRTEPQRKAMELLLTADSLNASQALELHLVNRVVPNDAVVAAAQELAEAIVINAPQAVFESRSVAARTFDLSDSEL